MNTKTLKQRFELIQPDITKEGITHALFEVKQWLTDEQLQGNIDKESMYKLLKKINEDYAEA